MSEPTPSPTGTVFEVVPPTLTVTGNFDWATNKLIQFLVDVILIPILDWMQHICSKKTKGGICQLGVVGRRALTTGVESSNPKQCFLLDSDAEGQGTPTAQGTGSMSQVQEELQTIVTHMEDRTDFTTDKLHSLYSSLLYGLVESDDEEVKQDIDQMIADAIGSIDTNGDGIIDVWEMEAVALPHDAGEFLFDDVVACTTTAGSTQDPCVSADNVVEFLNMFYGGTELVSQDLAEHIRKTSGTDACYNRDEFAAAFSTSGGGLDTLSAGLSSQPMDLSFVLSLAFGVGTALFVSGLSWPF